VIVLVREVSPIDRVKTRTGRSTVSRRGKIFGLKLKRKRKSIFVHIFKIEILCLLFMNPVLYGNVQ